MLHADDKTPAVFADIAYAWSATPESLAYLSRAHGGDLSKNGGDFAPWNRDPDIADKRFSVR
jgi:hypothetical protein